jgi:Tol biopolymer transport system component
MKLTRACINICILLTFISCSNDASKILLKQFLHECVNKQWNIMIVQVDAVKMWEPKTNLLNKLPLGKKISLNYSIVSPSIYEKGEKILFSVDEISGEGDQSAKLILYMVQNGSEEVLYKSKNRIISPVSSPDNKTIAFLSDYKSGNFYSLFIYNISTRSVSILLDNNVVYGGGYNFNISWSPSGNEIAFTDANYYINIININTKESRKLIKGYNPLFSPDGKQILFSDSQYKPYMPLIYNLSNGQTQKLKTRDEVYNAIWSPCGKYLIVVERYASLKDIFSFNEWGKKLIVYEIATKEKTELFKYEGFEYIDFK